MNNKIFVSIVVAVIIAIIYYMYYNNKDNNKSTKKTVVENYPQSVPMNVMYSDAAGNLSTTTDLGLQNLTVSSDSSIGGGLYVGGASKMNSTLDVGGAVNINGASKINSSLDVGGSVNINGASKMNSSLDVGGAVNINGASKLTSTLDVGGATTIGGVLKSTNAGVEIALNNYAPPAGVKANDTGISYPSVNTRINSQGIIFGGANNGREVNSAQITAGRHDADALCIVGMSKPDGSNRRVHMWAEGGTTHEGPMTINGSLRIGNIVLSDAGDGTLLINGKGMTLKDKDSDNTFKFLLDADDSRAHGGGQRLTIKNKNNNRVLDMYQGEVKAWKEGSGEPVSIFSRSSNDAFWNNRSYLNVRDYGFYASTTACDWTTNGHFGCNFRNALS